MARALSPARTLFPSALATKIRCLKYSNRAPPMKLTKPTTTVQPATTISPLIRGPKASTIATTAANTSSLFPKIPDSSPSSSFLTPYDTEPYIFTPSGSVSEDDIADDDDDDGVIMEEMYKNPFLREGSELPSDLMEDDDALYARIDMPGIGKEGVKLYVQRNTLHINGEEGQKDPEYNKQEIGSRKYSTGIVLAPGCYKTDQIKAAMKDGVLRVVVPKIKLQEKEGVFSVTVN